MTEAVVSKLESTVVNLADRLERHEDRLESVFNGMSGKLDALVEISRTMATLQERQAQHADGISELKTDLKAQRGEHAGLMTRLMEGHEKSLIRIHERTDKAEHRIGEAISGYTEALSAHCKQDAAIHEEQTNGLVILRHEFQMANAKSNEDLLRLRADATKADNDLEKKVDAFLNQVDGMKRMAMVLWGVMGAGVAGIIWNLLRTSH